MQSPQRKDPDRESNPAPSEAEDLALVLHLLNMGFIQDFLMFSVVTQWAKWAFAKYAV